MAKVGGTSWKPIPMFIIVLTIYTLNYASARPERRARHATGEQSTGELYQNTRSFDPSSPNSLTFDDENERSPENEKKVAHRLVGGHLRSRTTTTSSLIQAGRGENDDNDGKEGEETDEATWDDGLIIASAGNGKEKNARTDDDDDERKTLSQQVKEGKYGLIQNEIHSSRPKRPGIISYSSNPEIPRDNARNLGGLDEEEIWLAENHVLVLRGGNFPDHEKNQGIDSGDSDDWLPIDDYKAPKRQVKIPSSPKVPPPFPVQLSENGPVQIIGVNGTSDQGSKGHESPYEKGFLPGEGPFFAISKNATDSSKDLTSEENTTKKLDDVDRNRKIKSGHVPPRADGVIGPFYPALPPGAVFVVPPSNQSDYDEDDQSIYYPPPYSFYYKQDNSTPVPPGPLVPGIILPPPPDFFSSLEEKKPATKSHSTKYPKRPSTTASPRVGPTYYPPRKSSPKPHKSTATNDIKDKVSPTKYTSRGSSFTMKPINVVKYKTTTARSTVRPIYSRGKDISAIEEATRSPIDNATTLEIAEVYTTRPNLLVNSDVEEATKSKNRWNPNVSSNSVPLVTYYSSSTPSTIEEPADATPISVNNIITAEKQRVTPHQASYYFYEETNDDVSARTSPDPTAYYRATTQAPYYSVQDLPDRQQQQEKREHGKKSYYEAEVSPTRQTLHDYRAESLEPIVKTSFRYRSTNSLPSTDSAMSSRAKGQRMLGDSSLSYYAETTEQPRARYATAKPSGLAPELGGDERYDYDRGTKPKPIYQYSYESADYSKQRQQQDYYKAEEPPAYYNDNTRQSNPTPESFDEWQDIREESQQYDYEEGETLPEQEIREPERENHRYENRLPISYRTTTGRPIVDTTVNPQHAYYTRQEDQLLDDVTREYFTNFGKKLRDESLPSTTPIYGKTRVTTAKPDYTEIESYVSNDYDNLRNAPAFKSPNVRVHYGDQPERPYSLEADTNVNYKNPLPPIDTDSEWIPGYSPKQSTNRLNYRQHQQRIDNDEYAQRNSPAQRLSTIRNYDGQRLIEQSDNPSTNFVPLGENGRSAYSSTRPISLAGDVLVNYRDPRPPINPDAEYVDPTAIRGNSNNNNDDDKTSYFAYRLPGDSGHFYFLTPKAISQRQDDDGGGYYYQRPRAARFSRQRRPRNS